VPFRISRGTVGASATGELAVAAQLPRGLAEDGRRVKDAQGQMRHSRASTTLDIYQMSKHGPNRLEQIERLKR
jgi:hypothetical protein